MRKLLPRLTNAVNKEIDRNRLSAIYFLFTDGVLTYIGKTTDLRTRITSQKSVNNFDSFRFIECNAMHLDYYERRCIRMFKPVKNRWHYPNITDKELRIS